MGCGPSDLVKQSAVPEPVARDPQSSKVSASPLLQPIEARCSSLGDTEGYKSLSESAHSSKTQPKFEDVTKLVFAIFNVDITAVTLIDQDKCWFKTVQGQDSENFEMDNYEACFCSYSVAQKSNEVLVVEDARQDARFADFDIVRRKEKAWRFYAGAPLVTSHDHKIGNLCLIGYQPRKLTAQDCAVLRNLAGMVVKEIEHDQMLLEREHSGMELQRRNSRLHVLLNSLEDSIMLCEYSVQRNTWIIRFVNQPWIRLTEIQPEVAKGCDLWSIFDLVGFLPEEAYAAYQEAAQHDISFSFPVTLKDSNTSNAVYNLLFRPAASEVMPGASSTAIPAHVEEMGDDHTRYLVSVKPALAPTHSSKLLGSRGSRRSSLLQAARQPFDDVKLGPLLGKGGYGRVYRAVWNGAAVACKIIEVPPNVSPTVTAVKPDGEEIDDMPVEALLGMDMAHPNVVQTYRHTSLITSTSADIASLLTADDKAGAAISKTGSLEKSGDEKQAGRLTPKPQATEVWLLLEYCNKGTLRDGIDRGWFRTNRSAMYGLPDLICILATVREIASGMAHLHSLDILHGDLTSLNVLLASSDLDNRGFVAKNTLMVHFHNLRYDTQLCLACLLPPLMVMVKQDADGLPSATQAQMSMRQALSAVNHVVSMPSAGDVSFASHVYVMGTPYFSVADFGLSRVVEAVSVETKTYGTITHMPPELLLEGRLSKSADVYAFGVVLFELYTADRPWSGLRHAEVLHRVAVKKEQLQLPTNAPQAFQDLFGSCVSIVPEERPTFLQVLERLDQCQQQIDVTSWQAVAADAQYSYPMELLS